MPSSVTWRRCARSVGSCTSKPPFSGPEAVLAYLSRYTHRVAISNRRLIAPDEHGVTFRYKDYRRDGPDRQRTMTLSPDEFIRRFLLHVLPKGFHRIRHYGLLASAGRTANVARARELLAIPAPPAVKRLSAAGSASAMPLLRRSYGHRRDLSACGSGARATNVASLHRDHCVVTRRDEPQPAVEAMRLPPVGRHAPASITSSTTAIMTARSRCLPPSHHLHDALTQRNYHQVPRVNRMPQSPHHSFSRSRILKPP